jgi:Sec-independent protein translocase protein TatA
MGAIKPWHLFICLVVVVVIFGVVAAVVNAGRRK